MGRKSGGNTVLVTGGTGFVGSHVILKLLQGGYSVRTTVRSLSRSDEVLRMVVRGGGSVADLSFIEADLNSDRNWAGAVADCDFVLHVASPLPVAEPKDDREVIDPARDGALRVLRAAHAAGVKRVVLTSSFAAVGYSRDPANHIFTEDDWTDPAVPNPAYIRSKAIAEMAAWDYARNEGSGLELCVINPVGIFGPALGPDFSLSIQLIRSVLEGDGMELYSFAFGVIDVRDVADLHLKAMTSPAANGQRFIASADGATTFYEIGELIKRERPGHAGKVAVMRPSVTVPRITISNRKAKEVLNWSPIPGEQAILASVDSVIGL